MARIRRYVPDQRRSRRGALALTMMIVSMTLLIAGIGMDMANRKGSRPMATISAGCEVAGLAGGLTAYVANRRNA